MADIEKVIKGLERCAEHDGTTCLSCPYHKAECVDDLCADALALLKEQEQEIQFLKGMQLQTVNYMNEEDLGTAVAKILGLKGR